MATGQEYGERLAQTFRLTIAGRLREARRNAGMTQAAVAGLMNDFGVPMRQQGIASIEAGQRDPTYAEAVVLATIVGLPAADLAGPGELQIEQMRLAALDRDLARAEAEISAIRAARDACAARVAELASGGDGDPGRVEPVAGRAGKSR